MKVALIHNARFPIEGYGGTERLVWWMAKGLHALGHQVVLVAAPGSQCPYAEVRVGDFVSPERDAIEGVDVEHHFAEPPHAPTGPYVVTIGGNGKKGQTYLPNTIFVSRDMAARHHSESYVPNAVDPDDYQFSKVKESHLCFLAKASWAVKNVKGAIRVARRSGTPIKIIGGGPRWVPRFFARRRGVEWQGMLGGAAKARLLAQSRGLLFPVLWHEPFGIAVIESLVSGTPVIASPFGDLPDLVPKEVGFICHSHSQMVEAVKELPRISPKICREFALENFHYHRMVKDYLQRYEQVVSGKPLNLKPPYADEDQGRLLPLAD